AHFARRFADLVTEVDLIEARLGSGTADPTHSLASIRRLRSGLDTAHAVGDLDSLAARLDKLAGIAEEKAGEARAAREAARGEAIARNNTLVEEAEKIAADATNWKSAGDRLRAAQDAFFTRRSETFTARDAELRGNFDRKQELLVQAEALDVDADPRAAQAKLREIQGQWHDVGRVPRESTTALDRRLRAV